MHQNSTANNIFIKTLIRSDFFSALYNVQVTIFLLLIYIIALQPLFAIPGTGNQMKMRLKMILTRSPLCTILIPGRTGGLIYLNKDKQLLFYKLYNTYFFSITKMKQISPRR